MPAHRIHDMPMKERPSVRLPEATYAACERYARPGQTPGTVARTLIEAALEDWRPPRMVVGRLTKRMTLSLTDETWEGVRALIARESDAIGAEIDTSDLLRGLIQRGIELRAEQKTRPAPKRGAAYRRAS